MSWQNIAVMVVLVFLGIGIFTTMVGVNHDSERIARADRSIEDLNVTLNRTPCFGTCPVYELSIANDGSVRFEGIAFTETEGIVEAALSHDQMDAIAEEIVRSDFFGYIPEDECVEFRTDHPSVTMEIRWHERERREDVYLGCQTRRPDPVPVLADKIDKIVNTLQWIGDTEKEWL